MALTTELLLAFMAEMQRLEEEELDRLPPEARAQLVAANAKVRDGLRRLGQFVERSLREGRGGLPAIPEGHPRG